MGRGAGPAGGGGGGGGGSRRGRVGGRTSSVIYIDLPFNKTDKIILTVMNSIPATSYGRKEYMIAEPETRQWYPRLLFQHFMRYLSRLVYLIYIPQNF